MFIDNFNVSSFQLSSAHCQQINYFKFGELVEPLEVRVVAEFRRDRKVVNVREERVND